MTLLPLHWSSIFFYVSNVCAKQIYGTITLRMRVIDKRQSDYRGECVAISAATNSKILSVLSLFLI
jgi:hypothetical protein